MSDDYQVYLERYHATHVTPGAVLNRMVERATGSRPASLTRRTEGSNEVYLVMTTAGAECVLKVARYPGTDLAAEQWAMEQARAAGVPAPEVLLVAEEEGQAFMVQARAAGRPLNAVLPGAGESSRRELWRQAGATLGRLHTVFTGGFWERDEGSGWDFPDWRSMMDSNVRDRGAERPWLRQAGFTDEECDAMMRWLVRYRDDYDCSQPALCHCDYFPEHIFVDDEQHISAVIDFGDCCGDHPVRDLALLVGDDDVDFPALLRGYPGEWVRAPDFEERLYLHRLGLDIGYLAHFWEHQPDHPAAAYHVGSLRTTLAWLGRGE